MAEIFHRLLQILEKTIAIHVLRLLRYTALHNITFILYMHSHTIFVPIKMFH